MGPCCLLPSYAVGTGVPWGMTGTSGLAPFCSEMGVVGWVSSLGSTMLTWSGRGFLGPILPLESQGSMIFTLMPSTPDNDQQGHQWKCLTSVSKIKYSWNLVVSLMLLLCPGSSCTHPASAGRGALLCRRSSWRGLRCGSSDRPQTSWTWPSDPSACRTQRPHNPWHRSPWWTSEHHSRPWKRRG